MKSKHHYMSGDCRWDHVWQPWQPHLKQYYNQMILMKIKKKQDHHAGTQQIFKHLLKMHLPLAPFLSKSIRVYANINNMYLFFSAANYVHNILWTFLLCHVCKFCNFPSLKGCKRVKIFRILKPLHAELYSEHVAFINYCWANDIFIGSYDSSPQRTWLLNLGTWFAMLIIFS